MPAENTKFSSISRAICYFVPRKSYSGKTRFHRWNDFDRLTFSLGHDFCGYYGYDADGIRTYKLMGTCNISTLNGGGLQAQAVFDDMVLYPSPYMVVTPRGYTNHYYAGSERIASRVGNRCWSITPTDEWEKPSPEEEALQNFWNIGKEEYPFGEKSDYNSPTTNTTPINGYEEKVQYDCAPVELPEVDILHSTDMLGYTINCDYSYQNDAPVYYYHPDHLGSTSWVTNFKGNEHQFLAYLPYGEPLLDIPFDHYDSRYGMDSVRYKFTGKERDAETGYDYMEQRYYYPPLAFWLRPDPMMDQNINLSSYAYCRGNPMKYVDPNGEDEEQRQDAIIMAYQYVKMNPGNSYEYSAKGGPGEKVDCSGLASHCAVAGGEKDPNRGSYNGVRNIANNTQKIEDMNEIVAGNFVTFNTGGGNGDYSHIGIITDVIRDDNGNIVDFLFIHSGSTNGPTQTSANSRFSKNSQLCWKDVVSGFYKWDTRPDTYTGPTLPEIIVVGTKPSRLNPISTLKISPITINEIKL